MSIIAAGTTTTTALSSTGNTDGTLQLRVNGSTPSVTLNTLGAIGVGSSPSYGTSGQVLTSAGSTAAPSWSTNVSSQWITTGSDIYYTTGNVGIGTTTPSTFAFNNLVVASGSANAGMAIYGTGQTTLAFASGTSGTTSYQGYIQYTAGGTDSMVFATAATEKARITSAGYFRVGATAAIGSSTEIATFKGTRGVSVQSTGGAGFFTNYLWNDATTGDNLFTVFATDTAGTARGSIDYNRAGGVTRYNTSSDATLKNLIGDAPKQVSIDILNSTKIREYSWKDDPTNKPQIGVIAQELCESFKGAVSVGGDKVTADEDGNETTQYVPWAVDKTAFTFHLVAGWQEHQRIIQEQQAFITALTQRITALEGK